MLRFGPIRECVLMVFLFSGAVRGEVEHISIGKVDSLRTQFTNAKAAMPADFNGRAWKCDMYGVRSRMQIEHGLNLYRLKAYEGSAKFANDGGQVIKHYRREGTDLLGQDGSLTDMIRFTGQGELVGELTVAGDLPGGVKAGDSASSSGRIVLAYTVCR